MTDNNYYRKLLEGVSLDDLLKGVPSLPAETASFSTDSSSVRSGMAALPAEPLKITGGRAAAAPRKLFEDVCAYRYFRKSDFGDFRFPFFKRWNRLNYAQLVASGTARRVERTLVVMRDVERADNTAVYLENISDIADLKSLLSFSNVPYENAPGDWPVKEEKEIIKEYDLYEEPQKIIGKIYYVLPHIKKVLVNTGDYMLQTGYWKETCSLGGMGVVYFGSGIKDDTHNFNVGIVKNNLIHQQSMVE